MSSATSIDGVAADTVAAVGAPDRKGPARDAFRPWHFFVLVSLLAATAAVIMARDARPEQLVLISLTIGAAGFAGAALYRTLAPLVSRDVAPRAGPLTESLRAVLEREKALVLRSIKELEFDRAMGKVSPKDFDEMAGRLRARALTLMRQLDAGGSAYRELIEREVLARRQAAGSARKMGTSGSAARAAQPQPGACVCGTANDADASFCKRCGARLSAATAP
jgi:hypothetical protein